MNPVSRRFEWVLLAAVPLLALAFIPALGNAFLIKQTLAAPLAILALGLALWDSRRFVDPPRLPLLAGALFLAAALVSAILASNPTIALKDCLLEVLGFGLFLLGACGFYQPNFQKKLARAIVLSSLGLSLLGIAQWVFPSALDFGLQALGKMKVFSALGNPNYVACYLMTALPLSYALFRMGKTRRERLGWAGLLGLDLLCLALTDSRSGWLAAAFGLLAWVFTGLKKAKSRRLLASGLALILLTALIVGLSSHTGRGRFMIWAESLDIWNHHPLGVGFENFNIHQLEAQRDFFAAPGRVERYAQNASFIFDAHNEALNNLVETGPLGLLGWIGLVFFVLRRGYGKASTPGLGRAWYVAWAMTLFFLLWNTGLFYAPLAFNFWITGGILASPSKGGAEKPLTLRPRARRWIMALLALAFLSTAWWGTRETWASLLEHQGDILLATGPFDRDADFFQRALQLDPSNGFTRQKLGLALFFDNRYDEALESLIRARPLYGDIAIPYLQAEILARQGHYPEAVELYRFIQGAFPGHVTPPFMLGQIYLRQGKKTEARMEFEKVLAIPESPYNLRLDREKIRKQKYLAGKFLREMKEGPD
jgi:tetratricopeptide (TPR) repeat protein